MIINAAASLTHIDQFFRVYQQGYLVVTIYAAFPACGAKICATDLCVRFDMFRLQTVCVKDRIKTNDKKGVVHNG